MTCCNFWNEDVLILLVKVLAELEKICKLPFLCSSLSASSFVQNSLLRGISFVDNQLGLVHQRWWEFNSYGNSTWAHTDGTVSSFFLELHVVPKNCKLNRLNFGNSVGNKICHLAGSACRHDKTIFESVQA